MTRTKTLASIFAAAVFGVAAAGFVGCTSILGDFEVAPTNGEAGVGSGENGVACKAGSDCKSGSCTDGVCCESACSGLCEACNVKGQEGKCSPVPDGEDPANECKPEPLADAGTPVEPDATAPIDDDGGEGGIAEAGVVDAAGAINLPDGGVTQEESKCSVGKCDGARKCKFPKEDVSCGTKFCNTSSEAAGFFCDGKGHCGLQTKACAPFTCENNECQKSCTDQSDCDAADFCDGADLKCKPRKGNGITCATGNECQSGFCVTGGSGAGVCCNSECDPGQLPGATCKSSGAIGQCKCDPSLGCGTKACRLFYRDSDGDGFGDKLGKVSDNTAKAGCEGDQAPVGYSADKTDCDDGDFNVKPGQTAYFSTANAKVGFDYNCSGANEKYYPEYPGETCQFCKLNTDSKCSSMTTCAAANNQSRLTCAAYRSILCLPGSTCNPTCGYSSKPSIPNTAGFISTVACGSNGTYRTCGTCTAAGGAPQQSSASVTQLCH